MHIRHFSRANNEPFRYNEVFVASASLFDLCKHTSPYLVFYLLELKASQDICMHIFNVLMTSAQKSVSKEFKEVNEPEKQ